MADDCADPLCRQRQELKEKMPLIWPDHNAEIIEAPTGFEEGTWVRFYRAGLWDVGTKDNPLGRGRILFWIRVTREKKYPRQVETAYISCPALVQVDRADVHALDPLTTDPPARSAE